MMKKAMQLMAGVLLLASSAMAAVPVVSNVTAQQREDTKLVDIYYDVEDEDGDLLKIRVEVSDNAGNTYSVPAFSYSGDIGDNIEPGTNKHIVWDAGIDWDGEYSDQMRIKVIASDFQGLPGLEWGSEVPPGGFLMGRDGGAEGSGPSRHVNIPWSYWLSKYEIRNDEYCEFLNMALVAGDVYRDGVSSVRAQPDVYEGVPEGSPLINIGDGRDIRWNVNNFEVNEERDNFPVRVTWYGAVAFAQHYGYDLPTDAEWEKAARGPDHEDQDTHLLFPWGDTISGGKANYRGSNHPWFSTSYSLRYRQTTPVGYYDGDQTPLGPDMANAYNLYDMIGNVSEWTRSVRDDLETYPQPESLEAERHQLAHSSSRRVVRGGGWYSEDSSLYIYNRQRALQNRDYLPSSYSSRPDIGFRVIRRDLP